MSGPYIIPATGSKYNVFERLGHPGRYYGTKVVNNTTVDFTGSNYGYGAVMVGESSATGTILTSGGESVNIAHLTVGTIYDFSLAKITVNAKTVYALKRQR
jgi:glutamate/tyrosine decarboxylase-like PLP-dependent enzyme